MTRAAAPATAAAATGSVVSLIALAVLSTAVVALIESTVPAELRSIVRLALRVRGRTKRVCRVDCLLHEPLLGFTEQLVLKHDETAMLTGGVVSKKF